MSYHDDYLQSITLREIFWKKQAESISWYRFPSTILTEHPNQLYQWYEDGMVNMSYLCLDYHIEHGRGNQEALIWDSPVTGLKKRYTYNELKKEVATLAGALLELGLNTGDTAIIYMPMIPEAVIAMLACARLGITHSVVFGGFAPHELALRMNDAEPSVILSAAYGIEGKNKINYKTMVDRALTESSHSVKHRVYVARPEMDLTLDPSCEYDYHELLSKAQEAAPVALPSTHPLYILYTSGTTGTPKGIVRDTGGYAVALKYSMQAIYNIQAGDVYWAASDVGWVVGHSYIVYGPLLQGCTSILYEGKPVGTPDAGAFWRMIETYQVRTFFTAPTAIRAIRKEDSDGSFFRKYDCSHLQSIFLAGERCDPPTLTWLHDLVSKPVIDHWWQTESGWPMLAIPMGIEPKVVKPGSAGIAVCGFDISIMDEEGVMQQADKEGYVVVRLPLPPGCLPTLWKDDDRFRKEYLQQFQGYYLTGDGGYMDAEGYCFIMGRMDDVINVSGHRLSTGEMEEVLASHPAVAECAVVGVHDALRGQRPVALVVLKDVINNQQGPIDLELIQKIRDTIGAIAYLKTVYTVKRLPKTRSGKILRKTIRAMLDHIPYTIPSTIEDATVIDELKEHILI
ncbi:MAG: AMP-binding protein [Chitinophagaceae bacterium]|nr:AMP-binding protein [Chitinophagaceae bacterium]